MIDAAKFAREWIEAWNSRDMKAILSHYCDDFELSSQFIVQIAGVASGTLKGKELVKQYWSAALERMPDLHFEHIATMTGVDRVVIHYKGPGGRLSAEAFEFDSTGLVKKSAAHYAPVLS